MSAPATDWKEEVTPDEDARFLRHAEYLRDLQRARKYVARGLHVKQNLGLTAELVIDEALPEHARHGLGAKPGRYPAYVRISNGTGGRQHDRKGDIRGFALKVVGVDGKKVIPGMETARTQDFLLINHPTIAVRNADEFLHIVRAMQNPLLLLPRLIGGVGFGRALGILKKAGKDVGMKVVSVATTPYFSAAPIAWGPYAVKVSILPRAKNEAGAKPGSAADYLGEELTKRVQAGPVVYDFRIQHYTDPASTPIEEHDKEWQAPWLTIGTLTIPQQDPTSPRGQKVTELVDKASFDPWHALVEHKPIGNVMRARNHAYRLSTAERKAAPEPDGTERFE
jgi:hypothetical protein